MQSGRHSQLILGRPLILDRLRHALRKGRALSGAARCWAGSLSAYYSCRAKAPKVGKGHARCILDGGLSRAAHRLYIIREASVFKFRRASRTQTLSPKILKVASLTNCRAGRCILKLLNADAMDRPHFEVCKSEKIPNHVRVGSNVLHVQHFRRASPRKSSSICQLSLKGWTPQVQRSDFHVRCLSHR